MIDKDFEEFTAKAFKVAGKLSASIDDKQANEYLKKIYSEYKSSNKKQLAPWLEDRMKKDFIYMDLPPNWVGEPRWAYFKDVPMLFLNQFVVNHSNKKQNSQFPIGDTVYVFGSKNPPNPIKNESWRIVYRLVVKTEEGDDVILDKDDFFE